MTIGPDADRIANAAIEVGTPIPKSITDAPFPIDEYQEDVLEAFWALSTCRAIGMGALGPIPWDAIDRFAKENSYDDEIEYQTFVHTIRQLDEAFLDTHREQMERRNPSGKSGSFRRPSKASRARR